MNHNDKNDEPNNDQQKPPEENKQQESKTPEQKPDAPENNIAEKDIYAPLTEKFETSTKGAIDSLQEGGAREIQKAYVFCDSSTGIVVTSLQEDKGHIKTIEATPGSMSGGKPRQRFYFGIQAGVFTKEEVAQSATVATKRGAPRIFEVSTQADQLIQKVIPEAQNRGDNIQKKIDEESYEWFPIHQTKPEINLVFEDKESKINIDILKEMVQIIRDEIGERLGAKAEKIDIIAFKKNEHFIYSDNSGSKTISVVPRLGLVVQVKTTNGSEAFMAIRGAMKSLSEVMVRFVPDGSPAEEYELKTIAKKLAENVSQEAIDLDRAQGVGILGTECPVILAPQVAGVLAHEVFGHTAEADIICNNRRSKTAKVPLKKRLGSQVIDHPRFSIVDTPEETIIFFNKKVIKCNWGSLPVDGYGNKAKSCQIVKNGTMVNALMDRNTLNETVDGLKDDLQKSMREFGVSGSVRRENYSHPPQVRMRCTAIEPDPEGPGSLEEMIAANPVFKQKKGVYIKSCQGGWVNDETGDFEVIGNLCYLIENGQLTNKPIKGVRIHGDIQKITVKMIGNVETMHHSFTGYCGKNDQWVPVEGAGPLLLIENAPLAGGSYRPWMEIVEDYFNQQQEVEQGKRGLEEIYIQEFAQTPHEDVEEKAIRQKNHHRICLCSAILPSRIEMKLLLGIDRDISDYEYDEDNKKCRRKGKPYEEK